MPTERERVPTTHKGLGCVCPMSDGSSKLGLSSGPGESGLPHGCGLLDCAARCSTWRSVSPAFAASAGGGEGGGVMVGACWLGWGGGEGGGVAAGVVTSCREPSAWGVKVSAGFIFSVTPSWLLLGEQTNTYTFQRVGQVRDYGQNNPSLKKKQAKNNHPSTFEVTVFLNAVCRISMCPDNGMAACSGDFSLHAGTAQTPTESALKFDSGR